MRGHHVDRHGPSAKHTLPRAVLMNPRIIDGGPTHHLLGCLRNDNRTLRQFDPLAFGGNEHLGIGDACVLLFDTGVESESANLAVEGLGAGGVDGTELDRIRFVAAEGTTEGFLLGDRRGGRVDGVHDPGFPRGFGGRALLSPTDVRNDRGRIDGDGSGFGGIGSGGIGSGFRGNWIIGRVIMVRDSDVVEPAVAGRAIIADA